MWGGGGRGGIFVKEILWSRFLSKCLFTFVKVLMPLNTHPQTPGLVCVREPVFRWNLSSTSSVSINVGPKLLSKHDNLGGNSDIFARFCWLREQFTNKNRTNIK